MLRSVFCDEKGAVESDHAGALNGLESGVFEWDSG